MARLRPWFTQDRILRLHFLASPFAAAAATYGIAVWRLSRVPAISDFDKLAIYASMGVILYGMSAVVVDLGGQAMFYTIGAIIKFFDERKTERNANAVRIVSNDNDLTAQVIRENPTLAAQVLAQLDHESTEAAK